MSPLMGIGMLVGSIGLDILGTRRETGEIERRAGYEIERTGYEIERLHKRAAFLGSMTQEELHDLAVEKTYAKGALKAAQAGAGIKVGKGSAITQVSSLESQYRRKMELIAKKVGFEKEMLYGEVAMLYREAEEIKKRSKYAQEASWWELGGSLLGKGYELGETQGWWG